MSSNIARRRRPWAGYAAIAGGLVVAGTLYGVLSGGGTADAAAPSQSTTQVAQGKALFETTCASCHGLDAQGTSQAPSLIGAGAAAVDFQMSTGRMPAKEYGAENDRKPLDPYLFQNLNPAIFGSKHIPTTQGISDIASYVASLGGGPAVPDNQQVNPDGANTALGQQLFSTNCSQCHGFAGAGGALTYGKDAPTLNSSTPTQIYEAMLTGPEAMPVFGDGTVTPAEKRDIIAYVTDTRHEANPGGFSLARTGTVTEGLVAWLGGLGFLVLIAMWLTAKRRSNRVESEQ